MKRGDAFGNPDMMSKQPMTCEFVDQHELDRRYVAGRLSEPEAAAFEAHFFECDRCFGLVKGGAGVRSALAHRGALPADRPRPRWMPLAIAAGLGLVALGTWQAIGPRQPGDDDAIRGSEDSLAVRSDLASGFWRVGWPAVAEATSYRVRVFAEGGLLLLTKEVTDTVLALPADSLAALGGASALYLDVEGFDLLRRPVARSPLMPLRPRAGPP